MTQRFRCTGQHALKAGHRLVLPCAVAFLFLLVPPAALAGEDGEKESGSEWLLDGYARLGYRLRYTREYSDATEEDQDIRGILSLSLSDHEKKPAFSLSILGSFNLDVDGSPSGGAGHYRDVYNSYSGNFKAQLYSAYVESHQGDARLFLGRQFVYRGESLDFDGLRAEYKLSKNVNISGYAGIPSNLWESSHEGDHFAGGGLELGIPEVLSLRADYIHIRDKKTYEPGEPVSKDNLTVITAKYVKHKPFTLYCLYSMVNGRERRMLLRAKWVDKKRRLAVSASMLRQNVALADYSTELSPFYIVLAEYEPYFRYRFMMLKGLSNSLDIEIGADIRVLVDSADEGMLNHSYERYYGGVHLKGLLGGKVDVTLMAERWDSLGRPDRNAIEGVIKYKPSRSLAIRLGTEFSKYVYDYNFEEERENVYSAYFRADYKLSKTIGVRFRYSYNSDERKDYNLFEISLILNW
jgi:hypothetical protein